MDETSDWVTVSDVAARAKASAVQDAVAQHVLNQLRSTAGERPLTTGELQALAKELLKLSKLGKKGDA